MENKMENKNFKTYYIFIVCSSRSICDILVSVYVFRRQSEANRNVCDRLHFIAVCLVVQF